MRATIGSLLLSGMVALGLPPSLAAGAPEVDDRPAAPGEWGFRPAEGSRSRVNPPGFVWRPQKGAKHYFLQLSRRRDFEKIDYEKPELSLFAHCPSRVLEPGDWYWRFAYTSKDGERSSWSETRHFVIPPEASPFPMPDRETLLSRIPREHPRLFVRPEGLPRLRELARGELKPVYENLVKECERIVANPPPTAEPRKYPEGIVRGSDPWREIWWGNRSYTIRLLNDAATLGFTRLLGGQEAYGQLSRRLLMASARWDPRGATGYRYNDEAGMPYNYYFSRTYTFVHDLLTEEERAKCREVMKVRGEEMYRHLHPDHLWRPYGSHANRAWHFLGEVGIAFLDEVEGARDWLWFAMNVFYNAYPVWSDDDGGWHEGLAYWRSYIGRFLWWADIMRVAMDVDAYRKPYFDQVGYFPMYLQPPGARRGGFGDLCGDLRSDGNVPLMRIFAVQARNPHWQWYADAHGPAAPGKTYVDFVRGALPAISPRSPVDLPDSRLFAGTGVAMLHTDLTSAENDVFLEFKSSPFGGHSHGYDAQNSFVLYAHAEPLLIRSGRRDSYGSDHHRNWMWETRSVNSILVNGKGQGLRSQAASGKITEFHTSKTLDHVTGEAAEAYGGRLERFTRSIVFIKPEAFLIFDRLEAPEPSTFQWLLHAPNEMRVAGQDDITVENGLAGCRVTFLAPRGLKLSQTDRFDPPPRPRIKLKQWHLQAETPDREKEREFVTLIRPYRKGAEKSVNASSGGLPSDGARIEKVPGGYACRIALRSGEAIVLLRTPREKTVEVAGFGARTDSELAVLRLDAKGKVVSSFATGGGRVAYR